MIREYVLSTKGSKVEIEQSHVQRVEELTRVMDKLRVNGDSIRLEVRDKNDEAEKHKSMFGDSFALAKKEFRKWTEDAKKEMDERYP